MANERGPLDDLNQMEPIEETLLRLKLVKALNLAGFDWIEDVRVQWHVRVPNWSIIGFTGTPPNDGTSKRVLSYPVVREMQQKFALIRPTAN